jgi:asparagine synthase (glutamine-hydrolysing)
MMSIIFGLFYRDGKPVSEELETMYAGMEHFPHERHAVVAQGNCGFGHLLTYNTPEAVKEAMPRWVEVARLLFVAEGRIDNRDELFEALDIPAGERVTMPDGDIMLRAYLQWDEKCVDRLMGKWSLAAFHPDEQRLFVARDKWDYTAIDYYLDDKVFAFATSSQGLFPLPFIQKELDELMIARLLVIWLGDYDKTYFKGIRRLLPSRALRVTREKEEVYRYWNYANIKVREGLKLEDYVADLFDNLNKAVTVRLRSYQPVAATLSGGMDSSTVCVLAAEHLARQGKRLRTYSHVPQFAPSQTLSHHNFGDERPFVEAVVAASGNIDPVFSDSAGISPLQGIAEGIRLYGEPFHGAGNAYWMVDLYKTAVRDGYGTVLTGEFGNATTSWVGIEDALPAGELFRRRGVQGLLKKKLFKPVLYGDNPVARFYKRTVFGGRPWRRHSFCTDQFEKSLQLDQKIHASGFDATYKQYFRDAKDNPRLILDRNILRLPFGAYLGCETGLELRDPTGDQRVIESALAIPNQMYLGEMNKGVLRAMMKGRLPDQVRLNVKKGKQSSDLPSRLCAHREEMEHVLAGMDAYGFDRIADLDRLRLEWEKMQSDCNHYPLGTAFHLLRPVAVFIMCQMNA